MGGIEVVRMNSRLWSCMLNDDDIELVYCINHDLMEERKKPRINSRMNRLSTE